MATYFTDAEFVCRCGCGLSKLDPAMLDILDRARTLFGKPLVISSGTRCPAHNAAIGGAPHSAHLVGPDGFSHAADILIESDFERWTLFQIFDQLGVVRFEVSNKHLHVDNADYLPRPILAGTYFKEA